MDAKTLEERIESTPDVLLGKPVFRGAGIPMGVVPDLPDAGATPDEIADHDDTLTLAVAVT